MNVGSLFTGVGGFDLGLERAGHRIVFQCEIDPYRRRVLERHWPGVRCYEDVRLVGRDDGSAPRGRNRDDPHWHNGGGTDASVDLLCGGFPCQDLSVAGKRRGLAGDRSGLFFEFARIADVVLTDGGWLLIENVPGLLSSHGGRDFAVLLSTLAELGFHDLAWRVLDSRYFGVPQRRRRVFILARRSRGRSASEVLLEPESGGGDFTAGRETGPRVTERTVESADSALDRQRGGADDNDAQAGWLVAGPLTRRYGKGINTTLDDGAVVAHTLRSEGFDAGEDGTGRGTPLVPDRVREIAGISRGMDGAFHATQDPIYEPNGTPALGASAYLATGATGATGATEATCAFDPKPDGPRYAAMGDAVTVNVAHWIGCRLRDFA